MKLKVLGSGSSGNAYLLKSQSGESLLIECGLRFKDITKGIDFDISSVVGCILSHEHMTDHAKATEDVLNAGINVYTSQGTIDGIKFKGLLRPTPIEKFKQFSIGEFKVLPFDVQHDAKEPYGFLINHKEMGNLLFATDTTEINYKFENVNHWMIEANFSEEIMKEEIEKDRLNGYLANRIYDNHMSLATCIETLQENDLKITRTITLIHLSNSNSWGAKFVEEIVKAVGHKPKIAKKGLIVDL